MKGYEVGYWCWGILGIVESVISVCEASIAYRILFMATASVAWMIHGYYLAKVMES